MSLDIAIAVAAILLLLFLSAFFNLSETALTADQAVAKAA